MNNRTKAVEVNLKVASIISEFFASIDEDFENTDVRKMGDDELRDMFLCYVKDLSGWNDNTEKVIAKGESVADQVISLVRNVMSRSIR